MIFFLLHNTRDGGPNFFFKEVFKYVEEPISLFLSSPLSLWTSGLSTPARDFMKLHRLTCPRCQFPVSSHGRSANIAPCLSRDWLQSYKGATIPRSNTTLSLNYGAVALSHPAATVLRRPNTPWRPENKGRPRWVMGK